jgi:hypothetical protein
VWLSSPVQIVDSWHHEVAAILARLFEGYMNGFLTWVGERTTSLVHGCDLEIRNGDLETVTEFMKAQARRTMPFTAAAVADQREQTDFMFPFLEEDWKHP